jgi:hypothetical protein
MPGQYARSSGPNHGGDPAEAFSASLPGRAVAASETWTRGSLRPHLIRAWLQVVTPKGRRGASWSELPTHELLLAERAHEQHAEPEFVGERHRYSTMMLSAGLLTWSSAHSNATPDISADG